MLQLFEDHFFACTCLACYEESSTFFPLFKDQLIRNNDLIRMTANAARGIKYWDPQEAQQKYLQFIKLLQRHHTLVPTKDLCFLQDWVSIVLAMTARPDLSY